jgi:hypothetical protein
MKQHVPIPLSVIIFFIACCTGCRILSHSTALKDESADMAVKEKHDVISYASIRRQQIPSFAERASKTAFNPNDSLGSRGLFGPVLGGAVSLATNAVKKNDRQRQGTLCGQLFFCVN